MIRFKQVDESPKATRNLKDEAKAGAVKPSQTGGKPDEGTDAVDKDAIAKQVTSPRKRKFGKG